MEMKAQITFLLLSLLFISFESKGCKCKKINSLDSIREISFEQSDIVFLGKLIKSDSTTGKYSFQILELFKGNNQTDTINGAPNSSCSMHISDEGRWIVYASKNEKGEIYINQCGASRSFNNPVCFNSPTQNEITPSPWLTEDELNIHYQKVQTIKKEALTILNKEIKFLRSKNGL